MLAIISLIMRERYEFHVVRKLSGSYKGFFCSRFSLASTSQQNEPLSDITRFYKLQVGQDELFSIWVPMLISTWVFIGKTKIIEELSFSRIAESDWRTGGSCVCWLVAAAAHSRLSLVVWCPFPDEPSHMENALEMRCTNMCSFLLR